MKIEKVEKYEAGYSRADLIKKGALALTAASLICGGLASCDNGVVGDIEYVPSEYDGGQVCVSQDTSSDVSSDAALELEGDIAYVESNSED